MNYITRLECENTALRIELAQLRMALTDVRAYISSDKFSLWPYVSTADVDLRIREVLA